MPRISYRLESLALILNSVKIELNMEYYLHLAEWLELNKN